MLQSPAGSIQMRPIVQLQRLFIYLYINVDHTHNLLLIFMLLESWRVMSQADQSLHISPDFYSLFVMCVVGDNVYLHKVNGLINYVYLRDTGHGSWTQCELGLYEYLESTGIQLGALPYHYSLSLNVPSDIPSKLELPSVPDIMPWLCLYHMI